METDNERVSAAGKNCVKQQSSETKGLRAELVVKPEE